jgi:hypothetical protein
MVMSKSVADAKVSTGPVMDAAPKQDRWHTKLGKWNTAGTRVRSAILEYLDDVAADVPYSEIKAHLMAELPDDCFDYEGTGMDKRVVWQLGNTEVKALVATLVAEGKAVDQ